MSGERSNRRATRAGLYVRFAAAFAQALVLAALAAPVALSSPVPRSSERALTGRALRAAADARPRPPRAPRCRLADARGDRQAGRSNSSGREAIQAVIRCFVQTAVTRRAPALGFDISTRGERAGLTRRQWATGNIPVPMVPSPTGRLRFGPGPGPRTPLAYESIVFVGTWPMLADLVRSGAAAPWRVDYFQPFPFAVVPAP
jgi:hypothetical protein